MKFKEMGTFFLVKIGSYFNFENLMEIKDEVEAALTTGHRFIAFDLSECKHLTSVGTGLIANLHKRCLDIRGKVCLLNPTEKVYKHILKSKLALEIEIFDSLRTLEMAI